MTIGEPAEAPEALSDVLGGIAGAHGRQRDWDTRLLTLCLVTSLGTLVAVGWLMALWWSGWPAYFPPREGGLVKAGVISDAVAEETAMEALGWRYTFTPMTFKAQVDKMRRILHPELLQTYAVDVERDAKVVQQFTLSSLTVATHAHVVQRKGQLVQVHVDALRTLWLGDAQRPAQPLQADFILLPFGMEGIKVYRWGTKPAFSVRGE
jgi:hypothetical protein